MNFVQFTLLAFTMLVSKPEGVDSLELSLCLFNQCGPATGIATINCNAFCVLGGYTSGGTCTPVNNGNQCVCNGKNGNSALIQYLFALDCAILCKPVCTTCGLSSFTCSRVNGNLASVRCTCS